MRSIVLAMGMMMSMWRATGTAVRYTENRTSADPQENATGTVGSDFELLRTYYHFDSDGKGFKDVRARIRILDYSGTRQWVQLTFDYKPFYERFEIPYIRIVKHSGSTIEVPSYIIQHGKLPTNHKDLYSESNVSLPALSPGDVIEYSTRTIFVNSLALRHFWAQYNFHSVGVLKEQLEISVPSDVGAKTKTKTGIKTWITTVHGRRVYHWESPGHSSEWREQDDRTPDVQLTSFKNWQEVGGWYAELEKPYRVVSPEVQARAEDLTKGVTDDSEKIKALYNFVAKQIKYLSLVSLGVDGYEPKSGAETIHDGYGDCKDKAALLAALLSAEGFHASSVLISDNRNVDVSLPTPWAFTHVIIVARLGKKEVWLDPSLSIMPFGMLAKPLRAKQALVTALGGLSRFENTPASPFLANSLRENIKGSVTDNGTFDATVQITGGGDMETLMRQGFLGSVESNRPSIVKNMINEPGLEIKAVTITNPIDTEEPFVVSFQIRRFEFINETDESNIRLTPPGLGISPTTVAAVSHWVGTYVYKLELTLPHRFSVPIPKQVTIDDPRITYLANYGFDGANLTVERRLVANESNPSLASANERAFARTVAADVTRVLKLDGRRNGFTRK
jgi:transglutaminase-like putative cysteine protease